MSAEYYDHVDQQYPYALIGPIAEQVKVLERRAHHYVHHVRMTPEDQETLKKVLETLSSARAELERLREASGQPTDA